ncbi:hypothetical protein [Streptomyces sp. NPDC001315]|uniref:hypothetical protein n=1 Tax=Streptomyces sp. NPDC001315 TaxID=3364562 RepID=UPI0036B8E7A3
MSGGTNPPTATADKQTYNSSIKDFSARMKGAGVDVELSNHGFCDHGLERMEELRSNPDTTDNPFVVGTSDAQLFMQVMRNMLLGRIAQDQEGTTTTATALAASTAQTGGCGC